MVANALSFISRKQSLFKNSVPTAYFYRYNVKGLNYSWVFGIYTHPFTIHNFFWHYEMSLQSNIHSSIGPPTFLKCQLNAKPCPRCSSLNSEDDCTLQNERFLSITSGMKCHFRNISSYSSVKPLVRVMPEQ